MTLNKVVICRAAGLMGWVAECQYDDGRNLLDLDIQARELPECIELAEDTYGDVEVTVEADTFWTKRHNEYLQDKYGRTDFSNAQ
jgi:hypothetical protein